MNAMFVKYDGLLVKLMISQTKSSATRRKATDGMTYVPTRRRARSGAVVATFVAIRVSVRTGGGDASPGAVTPAVRSLPAEQARGRNECLHGEELLPRLLVDRDREGVGV